jgi:uncharacterized membrane protein
MPRRSYKNLKYRLPNSAARNLLDDLAERRKAMGVFRAKANERRSLVQRVADRLIIFVGSTPFFIFHIFLFGIWIAFNLGLFPNARPYDPFPFGLLTMILTLEQSLLTIFVIMSQNRSSDISDLRNEIDLQINIIAEQEISKSLHMLRLIGEHLNIEEIITDPEIRIMESALDHAQIEQQTRQELDTPSGSPTLLIPPNGSLG